LANKIVIIGDSHVDALKGARLERPATDQDRVSAVRIERAKGEGTIGDISFETARKMIAALDENDLLALAVGGNQHQLVALIQNPEPFDFFEPGATSGVRPDHTVLPYRVVWDVFDTELRSRDSRDWSELYDAVAGCRVYHLTPPPPKADEQHILRRFESAFVKRGLADKGVTPADIRLKVWRLQVRVFQAICDEKNIPLLPPPPATQTEEGFLKPEFYARDATHANPRYGALVLQELERVLPGPASRETGPARV
jgi:hypothetical protein